MRLLRTAAGGFINAEKIIRLVDAQATGWIVLLGDGEEVALSPYYSAPGRIGRDLPYPMVVADCAAETCCCEA